MGMLLAFAPFIAFAVVDKLAGGTIGLCAGAAVSAAILVRDLMSGSRAPKVLEIGTFILFGGLAAYAALLKPEWSIVGVRLRVDAGLLLIVIVSMAIQKPFTLQYAKEQTPKEIWGSPQFIRTNYVITAAWAVAFAILVVADLVMVYRPDIPQKLSIWATILALVGAFKFTKWYPERNQTRS